MILVAGSANMDFTVRVEELPRAGETVLGQNYQLASGGKGANQAVACAKAGGQVTFLGSLGQDVFADSIKKSLQDNKININHVKESLKPTAAAFISVSDSGENCITVASGANLDLTPSDLPELAGFEYLVLQLEIDFKTVEYYALQAKKAGLKVVLNASPAKALSPEILSSLEYLVVNEGELQTIAGALNITGDLKQQLLGLATAYHVPNIIVTLGAKGSVAYHNYELFNIPSFKVQVVDTTGAGDTYLGVFVAFLAEGFNLTDALTAASAGSGLACTKAGAQPSMPTRAEIEALLQNKHF